MNKHIRLIFMLFVIMMSISGCKPNTCSTSNDDCVEKPTASCILNDGTTYKNCGTCECIFVDPLVIAVGTLTDAKVGEEYKGKEGDIAATGGIQPYSWSLLIDPANSDKLDWLTIDPTTGVLSNKPGKLPDAPFSDGVKFKVVLNDSSAKGKDFRPDNVGISQEVVIKINDCAHECELPDGSKSSDMNATKCESNTLYHCSSYFTEGNCLRWDNAEECHAQCKNGNLSCCINACTQIDNDKKCIPGNDNTNAYVLNCIADTLTGCLIWDNKNTKQCSDKYCSSNEKDCKSCETEPGNCSASEPAKCTDDGKIEICGYNEKTGCYLLSSISCDDYKTCQDGVCQYVVGTTGAGGGKIFYVYPDGSKYLEASLEDQSNGAEWGCFGTDIPGSYGRDMG